MRKTDDSEFDGWWAVYPKRVDKGHARAAFKRARDKVSLETLMAATQRYAQSVSGKDPQFIPYPATWLNGERWDDDIQAPVVRKAEPLKAPAQIDLVRWYEERGMHVPMKLRH